jgi:hypothetical protein
MENMASLHATVADTAAGIAMTASDFAESSYWCKDSSYL